MGTRPKPTEHMATSEDDSPEKFEVAESLRGSASSERKSKKATSAKTIEQRIQNESQTSAGDGRGVPSASTVFVPVPDPQIQLPHRSDDVAFPQLPVAFIPKISHKKKAQTSKPSVSYVDLSQPGPSGVQSISQKKTRSKKFHCDLCQKSFVSYLKLQGHIKTTHSQEGSDSSTEPPLILPQTSLLSESHASSSSSTTTSPIVSILPTPSGDPTAQFSCEHCNKNFSSKFKLVRHVLIHSDRRQFSCTICERTFHRKDHLKNHIKVHSPTKKIYLCDREHCKKEYTSALSYKKHLAIHFAEEGHLDCKICFKKFETKSEILYHLKIHAGSRTIKNPNEKKFRCDQCERKFFTRKDVRRHLVVHTGHRDFLCQFCPQRFGRKDHLVRHIKKSHSAISLKSVKQEPEFDTVFIKVEPTFETLPTTSYSTFYCESSQQPPPALEETTTISTEDLEKHSQNIIPTEYTALESRYDLQSNLLQKPSTSFVEQGPILIPSEFPSTSQAIYQPSTYSELNPILASTADVLMEQGISPQEIEALKTFDSSNSDEILDPDLLLTDFLRSNEGLIQSSSEDSKPLPGFSQVFQNPP